jgi:ADP-heptose:LPS heptosyltransferase
MVTSSFTARAVSAQPPQERLAMAEHYLRAGCFRDGWALYEARREIADYPEHTLPTPAPAWRGVEDLAGRGILLWPEQGLGDMIQMLRFVPLIARRGARVTLAVQPELKRLAASLPGVESVIAAGDTFTDVDYQCPLLSLPHLLRIRMATIPAAVPYLRVPAGLAEAWSGRLGPKSRPRVGIVCSGNPANSLDRWRSIPAREFAPLLALRGVEFHLLQTDIRAGDRDCLAGAPNLRTHADALTDLAETAALAMNMDLIVTVCTVSAHLAGALGLPAWVMISREAYCLWHTGRTDSPWYPTIRLFRQSQPDEWHTIMENAAGLLRTRLPTAGDG